MKLCRTPSLVRRAVNLRYLSTPPPPTFNPEQIIDQCSSIRASIQNLNDVSHLHPIVCFHADHCAEI